jgi:hypothetical protein
MKTILFALLTLSFLSVGCRQDSLPTSPGAQQAASIQVPIRTDSPRRRAVYTGAPCTNVSGTWDVRYQGSCPTNGYLSTWYVVQTGCTARVKIDPNSPYDIDPDVPQVNFSIKGTTVNLLMLNGFVNCTYHLEGTGTVSNGVITAVVSGPVGGVCCKGPDETVQLVATKR